MRILSILPLVLLGACYSYEADVSGAVDDYNFDEANTVMFGGPFLFISDVSWDCRNLYWVSRHYEQGEGIEEDVDFAAVQFTYSDPYIMEGIFNVAGEAQVSVRFLHQADGAFETFSGRGRTIEVESYDDDVTVGNFDVEFDDGTVSGTFTAEPCVNLADT